MLPATFLNVTLSVPLPPFMVVTPEKSPPSKITSSVPPLKLNEPATLAPVLTVVVEFPSLFSMALPVPLFPQNGGWFQALYHSAIMVCRILEI